MWHHVKTLLTLVIVGLLSCSVLADTGASNRAAKPRPPVTPKPKKPPVYTPSVPSVYTPSTYRHRPVSNTSFPWKRDITATIFWVGETPTPKNPTSNEASSWDTGWKASFGGYDDPNPANRTVGYRPKAFVPAENPFYVALPYNDVEPGGTKSEARQVVPWFKDRFKRDGHTTLKGQWLVIRYKSRFCFAQWEDCGPFVTDDWPYVFGRARPKNQSNNGAGIDLSPAVRDYLKLSSGNKVDWRFVSDSEVQDGPWKFFGENNRFAQRHAPPKPKIEELYEQRARALRRGGMRIAPRP